MKWCGKSAPAAWRHVGLVNPIGSKVKVKRLRWPADSSGKTARGAGQPVFERDDHTNTEPGL